MKRIVLSWLTVVEWLLLIVGALMIAAMVIPYSDMYNFGESVRDAKREGIYFEGPGEKQTYFGRSLKVEGVFYDQKELTVQMKACHFGPHSKLPQRAYLKTMDGEEIGWSGAGSSSTVFCSKGYFTYEDVPSDLKQVVLTNEAYGESFSFNLNLERGGDS